MPTDPAGLCSFRKLLRQSFILNTALGDEYISQFFRSRCKSLHRPQHKHASAVKKDLIRTEAQQLTRLLRSANKGSFDAIREAQKLAYGQKASQRHRFLRPHLREIQRSDKPSHPLLSSPIAHTQLKRLKPGPPWPVRDPIVQGPLPKCRIKKIRNRWWNNIVMQGIRPPLPALVLSHLEAVAQQTTSTTSTRRRTSPLKLRSRRRQASLMLNDIPVIVKGQVRQSPHATQRGPIPPCNAGLEHWIKLDQAEVKSSK